VAMTRVYKTEIPHSVETVSFHVLKQEIEARNSSPCKTHWKKATKNMSNSQKKTQQENRRKPILSLRNSDQTMQQTRKNKKIYLYQKWGIRDKKK
jgi:ribosome-binding ATPase YchF (GTP1/OBG family)